MALITAIRTIRIGERPNLIWVEIETDEGLTGLGESFRGAQATEAVIHELVAPWLLGRDARSIEAVSRHLMHPYVGFGSAGAEIRAASAIDIALWDLMGLRHGIPVHEALGGAARPSIRAYNTCAGYSYNTSGVQRRDVGSGRHAGRPLRRPGRLHPRRRRPGGEPALGGLRRHENLAVRHLCARNPAWPPDHAGGA